VRPALAAVLALVLIAGCATTDTRGRDVRKLSGLQMYEQLCSSCHGVSGRGDGPVASLIKIGIPDLTRIAYRDGGEFPTEDVRRAIDGRWDRRAHGARDMPVWGWQLYGSASVNDADERAHVDSMIDRLVEHLRSIQVEGTMLRLRFMTLVLLFASSVPAWSADYVSMSGKDLYERFCASCHGSEGRGDGPVAGYFTVEVPDLTLLARRARGAYPRERVARIIDGRHIIAAHGSRTMPIWGEDLSRSNRGDPNAEQATRVLIERLTDYVAGLQRPAQPPAQP
jgi:mono/diheme cytochrome c family protein